MRMEPETHREIMKGSCVPGEISYPGVAANWLLALLTGVGVQALIAFHTVGILLSQDVLLPKQGLFAVVAVVALSHFDPRSGT